MKLFYDLPCFAIHFTLHPLPLTHEPRHEQEGEEEVEEEEQEDELEAEAV